MRYFIKFSYKGTNYHGWQIQPNDISVQSVLTDAMSLVFRFQVELTGAGRTDAGVHAANMIAHFDLPFLIEDSSKVVYRLNSLLPKDISIDSIFEVEDTMHARFSAKSRTYKRSHGPVHLPPDRRLGRSSSAAWSTGTHSSYWLPAYPGCADSECR